jgi:hypothetical protein
VNKSSCLKRVVRAFPTEVIGRPGPQFLVDEQHQTRGCIAIAVMPLVQGLSDVGGIVWRDFHLIKFTIFGI